MYVRMSVCDFVKDMKLFSYLLIGCVFWLLTIQIDNKYIYDYNISTYTLTRVQVRARLS